MIDNTFVESYFRIENNLTTNSERFDTDRGGKLVYTTPYFDTESIVSDQVLFAGQNIAPENANLIIDQITLFSTNPNCLNYLPLKLRLGTKQQIDFNTPIRTDLTDYKIIVDPPINLETIQNRKYDKLREYSINTLTQVNVVDSARYGKGNLMYTIDTAGNMKAQDLDDNQVTDPSISITAAAVYASEEQAMYRDELNKYVDITDPANPFVIVDFDALFDFTHINTFLSGQTLYVIGKDGAGSTDVNILVRSSDDTYEYVDGKVINSFTDQLENSVGVLNLGTFISWDQENDLIQFSEFDGSKVKISPAVSIPFSFITTGDIQGVFLGGPDLSNPVVSLFATVGDELHWRYFNLETPEDFKTRVFDYLPDGSDRVKSYRNTVYFHSEENVYIFCNLDTGIFNRWSTREIDIDKPYPKDYKKMWVDSSLIAINSREGIALDNAIQTTTWRSTRDLNKVYSMSYTYDNRVYPYAITGNRFNFTLSLPNNTPISELELFKYVIDIRIRYTKVKKELLVKPRAGTAKVCTGKGRYRKCRTFRKEGPNIVNNVDKLLGLNFDEDEVRETLTSVPPVTENTQTLLSNYI